MSVQSLQDWLDGKYVSPVDFKLSLQQMIGRQKKLEQDNEELLRVIEAQVTLLTKNGHQIMQKEDLISLNLWAARRLHPIHKRSVYDELEKITGQTYERL